MEKVMKLQESWQLCVIDNENLKGSITCQSELPENWIDAKVPGDWVLDYVRAGLMDEPYYQDNYLKIRDFETSHIFYSTKFEWVGNTDHTFLRFEGIDTVADIYLNGKRIGHAENMYIPHEFEAENLIQGENELLVHIKPVGLEARKYPISPFYTTLKYNYEALVIRKATHMFGWDICPRIVTSGLWRGVSVVQKKAERIENIFLWIEELKENGDARCGLSFDVDLGDRPVKGYELRVEGECITGCESESAHRSTEDMAGYESKSVQKEAAEDSSISQECSAHRFETGQKLWYIHGKMGFTIEQPKLWWPRGYGEQNLYQITVTLLKDGKEVDRYKFRQGLRTAELINDELMDENGNGDFCFVINGKRIYVLGTNWVPADAFHSNDDNRIPDIIDLVTDIGCNAMRVWGGGVYESDLFYDLCDEKGILIWQDFMMACGVYPHTERMLSQLEEEATVIVRRLRQYACICLWAGDNECDQSYCWGDSKRDPSLNVLTREVLPRVLRGEDMSRPYLPSSPYVSHQAFVEGRQEDTPEQHLWGPRDYFKGHFYHDATAVFASEMGYHGCNSPESIYRFIGKEKSWPVDGNEMYLYHAASPEISDSPYTYRIPLMSGQLKFLFGQEPENLEEYAKMSQISQAEAKKFFVESFRSRRGKRTGLIWWNMMDCWPQISDAVVDYYFCKKLAYFFIRRSQQPVCLMMDDHTGELVLYGVSERHEDCRVKFCVRDVESGRVIAQGENCLAAEASTPLYIVRNEKGMTKNSVLQEQKQSTAGDVCSSSLYLSDEPHFYGIEWELSDGRKGDNHYLQGEPPYDFAWYMNCLEKMGYDEFEGF